jgi:flagella basal body P-ring formation protein FlgA
VINAATKFSFLAGNMVGITAAIVALITVVITPAVALETVSGATLKVYIKTILAKKGLESAPILAEERQFRACRQNLQLTPMFGDYRTVKLTCPDADGFQIAVRTRIDTDNITTSPADNKLPDANTVEVLSLARSVSRGEILEADDLVMVAVAQGRHVGHFTRLTDVVGRRVKQTLGVNQVLLARHLDIFWDIQQDQTVLIETSIGNVTVASTGIALENAQIGQIVGVKNQKSGQHIEGIAVSRKKIRILTK